MLKQYISDLKTEFSAYSAGKLMKDALAGLTVAAIALPLALAFGVSSGADAAAGLITAILAGIVISALSGASYQISGPTGAMAAILMTICSKYQLAGMFTACFIAGAVLILAGCFKLGRIVSIIPLPVITGFTSGIAVIIAMGQLDNFFGVKSSGETALARFASYFTNGFHPTAGSVIIGVIVIAVMMLYPKKWSKTVPSSLIALILVLLLNGILKLDSKTIGTIPQTLMPDNRLTLSALNLSTISGVLLPAFSVAALGMIESLMCGATAGRMKGEKLNADRELIAQGIGNMILPFFGGVPATAAIARTSVAIKAGAQTRLTGIFHAVWLLLSMFLLGSVMSAIPLSALAAILMVTAWRMNEWENIKYLFGKKFKSGMVKFLFTMVATVVFDLTIAILIGIVASVILFVMRVSNIEINESTIDHDKLSEKGIDLSKDFHDSKVFYITGSIFFGTANKIREYLLSKADSQIILLSMRGVSSIDTSGVQTLLETLHELNKKEIAVKLCGIQSSVRDMLDRGGVTELVGEENIYWSVDQAIAA